MLKSKRKITIFAISFCFLLALALPLSSHAAGLVPCGGTGENPCTVKDAFYMVARVTNWLVMTAGLFAVFQIVSRSFWLTISMGNEEDIAKNKKGITNAVIGFFVVLGAYMFVNTAVNFLLLSKCELKFSDPLSYLTMKSPNCTNPNVPTQ